MTHKLVSTAIPFVALAALAAIGWQRTVGGQKRSDDAPLPRSPSANERESGTELPTLKVTDLFERGGRLEPTERTRSLDGKRVRLLGFMADMELPPQGAFYLVPAPLKCDEAGAGEGDLPPESVLVSVASLGEKAVTHVPGLLEAVGRFAVGNRADTRGRTANFRLELDESSSARRSSTASGAARARSE